jgi:hypothetical protein
MGAVLVVPPSRRSTTLVIWGSSRRAILKQPSARGHSIPFNKLRATQPMDDPSKPSAFPANSEDGKTSWQGLGLAGTL